ncbi:MAG: hypothetical protein CMK09_00035 [Ponticaulis sp.]|nr:hypothetical protein [Ponticaulis sp.]
MVAKLARTLIGGIACVTAGTGIAAADWTRSYVIEWYEPAHYYGAETGIVDAGTDCPAGSNPEIDYIKVLTDAGYTQQEAEWLRDQEHPYRLPNHGSNQMAFRGENRANVYTQPWTYPDPGLTPVTGEVSQGINLDGDATNGFVSPDGEQGIDNEFYRTVGCWKTYRGPDRLSSGAMTFNDSMREGSWTVAIVVSGEGDDPMNDENVTVAFYDSKDALVKDGMGEIAWDYTFAVSPHAKYEAIFEARTENGRIRSTRPSEEVWFRDPSYSRDLQLLEAQVDLNMNEDGTLTGVFAGYRPWEPVYEGWVRARGTVIESLTWVNLPGVWYALKRNADYSPDGADGEKTHISFAMRVEAIPAYVMVPDATNEVAEIVSYVSLADPADAERPQRSFTVDGIVPDRDGIILAGPDAPIVPPTVTREELKARLGLGSAAGGR